MLLNCGTPAIENSGKILNNNYFQGHSYVCKLYHTIDSNQNSNNNWNYNHYLQTQWMAAEKKKHSPNVYNV